MKTKAPVADGAADRGKRKSVRSDKHIGSPSDPQPPSSAVDIVALRDRLLATRARLLEQVANDWQPDRIYPDTAWCRMLADVQGAIQAVDAVVAEGG